MSKNIADIFKKLSSGVYVVGVAHGGTKNAFTAAWISQVSYIPLVLSLSVNPQNASYRLLRDGKCFSINVLGKGQLGLARHFGTQSGRDLDKLGGMQWQTAVTGSPILTGALAYFDCQVTEIYSPGDHHLVLGRVMDGEILEPKAIPMLYGDTGSIDQSDSLYPDHF